MKNQLYVGTKRAVTRPDKGGYLFISDAVPKIRGAQIFDPKKHSFNALYNLDYRRSCDFVDIIGALFPEGENTLTRATGLDFIAEALEEKPKNFDDLALLIPKPDKAATSGHVWAYGKIQRLLRSPVLKRVLCGSEPFPAKKGAILLARIDRAELGEFDALAIGLFLMSQYRGQIVLPDGGFYLREMHSALLREGRLIFGCNFLDELPPKLRQLVMLAPTVPQGATFDDAETLANQACLIRGTVAYNDFVAAACA